VKYRDFVAILTRNGFKMLPRTATSHRKYEGFVSGKRQMVMVSGDDGDDIMPGTLASMIRTSGLPKKTFRR
jgi:predicted RNA binding protein YcfA (HicA-like mRNA interferase family)